MYSKAYYLANKEKIKEYNRVHNKIYRLAHEKRDRKVYSKAYRLKNKDKIKMRRLSNKKYLINKDESKRRNKIYYSTNREKLKKRGRMYYRANKERFMLQARQRKALKLGNNHEPYADIYIFERDNWECQICGQKINKRLKWPHSRSKSIDHIIPLIKGGMDAPINLQAAHLRCNQGKHANSGGQLRLIG